jgi:hypothetical protein
MAMSEEVALAAEVHGPAELFRPERWGLNGPGFSDSSGGEARRRSSASFSRFARSASRSQARAKACASSSVQGRPSLMFTMQTSAKIVLARRLSVGDW